MTCFGAVCICELTDVRRLFLFGWMGQNGANSGGEGRRGSRMTLADPMDSVI